MDFRIIDLMDEQACYAQLVDWLHPHGMTCPRRHQHDRMVVHRRGRDPVLDFRCRHTDEWCGYYVLPEMGRSRATICNVEKEWARDDDGDGIREVHVNTLEGLWTGLRNFLRPFRGVSKVYLYQYVAMFEWSYNTKRETAAFVGALSGVRSATICPT